MIESEDNLLFQARDGAKSPTTQTETICEIHSVTKNQLELLVCSLNYYNHLELTHHNVSQVSQQLLRIVNYITLLCPMINIKSWETIQIYSDINDEHKLQ